MKDLKPCPFCGGEASVKVLEYDDDCKVWGVFCESDLASEYSHGHFVDNYATEAEAIAAWNTRAERTCKPVEMDGVMRCPDCDYPLGIMSVPAYCAGCGAKVVGE